MELRLGLSETMNHLAMASSVHLYSHVLKRGVVMSWGGLWTSRLKVIEEKEAVKDFEK